MNELVQGDSTEEREENDIKDRALDSSILESGLVAEKKSGRKAKEVRSEYKVNSLRVLFHYYCAFFF